MTSLHNMNLNYLYNVAYYNPMKYSHYKECNNALCERSYQPDSELIPFQDNSFILKTTYPGLLIGLGYTHEARIGVEGDEKDGTELKLGFTLDYVTGLPIIPGSTIKGILRSAFHHHPDYIACLIGENEGIKSIENFEKIIFKEGQSKIIFFDAIPVTPGRKGKLIGLENITPHPDPLKGPNSLSLLKVIPGVEYLFRFGCDAWDEGEISVTKLLDLFRNILCDLGIGAKTNVGFGAMEEVNCKPKKNWCWLSARDFEKTQIQGEKSEKK